MRSTRAWIVALAALAAWICQVAAAGVEFIDTSFENASPLWHETAPDGTIRVHLIYDHERGSPNRAAGHVHFRLHAAPGATLNLELTNLQNVWNGQPGSVAREMRTLVTSVDGQAWEPIRPEIMDGTRVRFTITMPGPRLFIARVEPYRLSDLDKLLATIRGHPLVQIETVGKTVEGRGLEIIRIGRSQAPRRVFLRARAHPWEAGGNWVVQGLIRKFLRDDPETEKCLDQCAFYIMPMANKDGVARGMTRFNLRGKDLNRNWDKPADPELAPENAALEKWLEKQIASGQKPDFALELHNDGNGLLHVSRPPIPNLERHLDRMKILEELLRKHTWFTEGSTKAQFRNSGTLAEGWLQRYGIDAAVHEFNCHWSAGLQRPPLGRDWEKYGAALPRVFEEYFRRAD